MKGSSFFINNKRKEISWVTIMNGVNTPRTKLQKNSKRKREEKEQEQRDWRNEHE